VLLHFDKRYRTRYKMSMIENLGTISASGIGRFLASEKVKWTCSKCGGIICVHKGLCSNCGAKK
jgi:ribosomal protein S27AE